MSDVKMYHTVDGGNIELQEEGVITIGDGVGTAVYLSLFGGNEDDAGGDDLSKQWWGNDLETDPAKMYRSKTQNLLRSIPATSANLRRIQTAAEEDLEWMKEAEILTRIDIAVYIPRPNWVKIIIDTDLGPYDFTIPWEAAA